MAYVDTFEASAVEPPVACDPFGPLYPVTLSAAVTKGRRIKDPTREQRRAHGEAVGTAIRELQRRELQRELPSHPCPCASGTWHSGEALTKAIRSQHAAKLQRDALADRARRTDDDIRAIDGRTCERSSRCRCWTRSGSASGEDCASSACRGSAR